jgi:DNA-directed RNA polymerase specialized sigma24 family protein
MFQSTVTENFESWDNFLDAYYEPIRTALKLIPFVGESRADDLAQSFFLKMYERDILDKRPAITGKFRNWLYVAARRHAVDDWRKRQRRAERSISNGDREPVDPALPSADDAPFDADEVYALSILHMTVARVRKHLVEEGKSEHWMIFEELVLAPLIPGRLAKTREELAAMFPGQPAGLLDNRVTTVKRVFRRILPALVPADPTENLTPEERFEELLEILHASKNNRLWLAFLTCPAPVPEQSTASSDALFAPPLGADAEGAVVSPEILQDELRVLLGFWLEMPLVDYLDDLEGAGASVAKALKDARPPGPCGLSRKVGNSLNLNRLTDGTYPVANAIPADELITVLERLKTFAKRVHKLAKQADKAGNAAGAGRRENSMPLEIAQVLYDLAGALSLTRCGARVVGLTDERYRKNVFWLLSQPWLDARLRPIFFAALKALETEPRG